MAWTSYDGAAESHDRLAVPAIFLQPARELVRRLDIVPAHDVLDVGAGTGVASRVALESAPGARVVALDPSLEMLRMARTHGVRALAQGAIPGLPFADASFDRVMASFVLSHVPSCGDGLRDMARVLRPGGKVGATAWGPLDNEFRARWQEVAERYVSKDEFQRAMSSGLPGEERFGERGRFRAEFIEAGLADVEMHYEIYEMRMSVADYLQIRENNCHGRLVRRVLDSCRWDEFRSAVKEEFEKRFAAVVYTRDVHIAVARKLAQ